MPCPSHGTPAHTGRWRPQKSGSQWGTSLCNTPLLGRGRREGREEDEGREGDERKGGRGMKGKEGGRGMKGKEGGG